MTQNATPNPEMQATKRYIGLRNICLNTLTEEWRYLLFFELDDYQTAREFPVFDMFNDMSYVCYETKHGYHWVGLTPLTADVWGEKFAKLINMTKHKYAGQTIRLSRKDNENQRLLHYDFTHPTISNLFRIYQNRFRISEYPHHVLNQYRCVYEWYTSKRD